MNRLAEIPLRERDPLVPAEILIAKEFPRVRVHQTAGREPS